MEKKIYKGVISKATPTTTPRTTKAGTTIDVPTCQFTFANLVDAEGKDVDNIDAVDKEGNDTRTRTATKEWCKVTAMLVNSSDIFDFALCERNIAIFTQAQRLICMAAVGTPCTIIKKVYDATETNPNGATGKKYIETEIVAAIDMSKYAAVSMKLLDVATRENEKDEAKEAAKLAAQNAAVYGEA